MDELADDAEPEKLMVDGNLGAAVNARGNPAAEAGLACVLMIHINLLKKTQVLFNSLAAA